MLLCGNAFTQSLYPVFEYLTAKDGLSSDKIESIIQDREGFYWIATQNGLNRYDGTTFKIFRHHEGYSTSLTNDFCTDLAEDSQGNIWVATVKGICRYTKSTGRFQQWNVSHPTLNAEIVNRIWSIVVDNKDHVWISGVRLWKLEPETNSSHLYSHNPNDLTTIPDNGTIGQIAYDSLRHGLWIMTDSGLNFLDLKTERFYHKNNNPEHWSIFDQANDAELCLDDHHQVWFRNKNDMLSSFLAEENKISTTPLKLSFRVKNISADHRDRIWLYHWSESPEIFDPRNNYIDSSFFKKHHARSIRCERMEAFFQDENGNYWIGSNLGISIYNDRNQFYRLHQLYADRDSINILAVCQTNPGQLWLSTDHGLFQYQLNTERLKRIPGIPSARYVSALCVADGNVWMSTKNQLICIDADKELIRKRIALPSDIFFIKQGRQANLWVGLWTGGLCDVHTESGSWKQYQADSTELKTNSLVSALADKEGLWIGYNGGYGFSRFSYSSSHFTHFHPDKKGASKMA